MPEQMSKKQFIELWLRGDLEKWLGEGPKTVESFAYSVEEWACGLQGQERRKRQDEEEVGRQLDD